MKNYQKRISKLKRNYKKVLEISLSISLILVAFLFYSFKSFEHELKLPKVILDEMEIVDIPQTEHSKPKPPPPPLPPIDEPDQLIYELVEKKPVLLKHAQPYYPEMARKSGVEGIVVVKVLIDKKGNVEKAEIFKSIPVLDDAALKAAKKCKFKPAKQRDKLVKVWMIIPYKFKLK